MHEYAQKSTTTTLPRRLSGVSGALLSQPVAPSSGGNGPSVFDGPLAPCADIIAPPSAGFSAAAIIMAPLAAGAAGAVVALGAACAPARFDARTVTGVATYSAGSMLWKLRTFGRSLMTM